jgi:hypothetical protein
MADIRIVAMTAFVLRRGGLDPRVSRACAF